MANKKSTTTSKKETQSKVEGKVADKKSEINSNCAKEKSNCKCGLVFLTIILSVLITASIIITVPLWMGKILPPEKQPAFLRKALMPITNVKVIATKPLPNEVDKYIEDATNQLQERISRAENNLRADVTEYDSKIAEIENSIKAIEERNSIADEKWQDRSMQYQMFLVTFYNLYEKALSGQNYDREMELLDTNLPAEISEGIDLSWTKSYSKRPPLSLENLSLKTSDNYSTIIKENIRSSYSGLKEKFLIALNNIMVFDAPADNYKKGSLKYNLKSFVSASSKLDDCSAMKFGKLLSSQSKWFATHIMNELEARCRINKELYKVRNDIEKQVYSNAIENMSRNLEKEMEGK